MGLLSAYLVLYNAACMAGWGYALFLGVSSLATTGGDLTKVWAAAETPLLMAQWTMLLEIVHALTGAVKSPVFTTALQVMSRIYVVVIVGIAPAVTAQWGCGMMALSWSLVEIFRYAFCVNNLPTISP